MIRRFPIFAASLVLLSTASAAEDCKLHQVQSPTARLLPSGAFVVDTTVNGIPAVLLLSTGHYYSMVTTRFARAHDLPLRDITSVLHSNAGATLHEGIEVAEFKAGGLAAHNELFVASDEEIDSSGTIDGVLGYGFMRNFDIEIDAANNKVNFLGKEHCPGKIVYWADSWFELPIFLNPGQKTMADVVLDGKPVRTWISTGAEVSTIQYQSAHELFGLSFDDAGNKVTVSQAGPEDKPLRSFIHNFGGLALGPITLHNMPIRVKEYGHFTATHTGSMIRQTERNGFPDLDIGMDVLKRMRLILAYSDAKMYFTLNEERPQAAAAPAR